MSEPTAASGPDGLEETLGRLSKKPGVKAAMVLDRKSGVILKTSGEFASILVSKRATSSLPASSTTGSFPSETASAAPPVENQGPAELAAMVWTFVTAAGGFVEELDTEDELKLLRLRTKKQELVIVPDAKYLMVVIHDTPPA